MGRRAKLRFDMQLNLRWATCVRGHAHRGNGATVNISSEGVFFRCGTSFRIGSHVWLTVEWPVTRDGDPVDFEVRGIVVRATRGDIAIRILASRLLSRQPGEGGAKAKAEPEIPLSKTA
jgi:hypothetical protein